MGFIKKIILLMFLGALVGGLIALFLISLDLITSIRQAHLVLVYALPFAGVLIGFLYLKMDPKSRAHMASVLLATKTPGEPLPNWMAPLIWTSTLLTHLCGGSAGRESTAVQIAASVSDSFMHRLRVSPSDRSQFLRAAVGAGFGAAVGAPVAGAVFGLELSRKITDRRGLSFLECFISSLAAVFVARWVAGSHRLVASEVIASIGDLDFLKCLMASIGIGALAGCLVRGYLSLTRFIQQLWRQLPFSKLVGPFVGGCLLIAFYSLVSQPLDSSYLSYQGLGIEQIQSFFLGHSLAEVPIFKFLATALTQASGFKGGEFIPFVFIGSALGSWAAGWLLIPASLGAALGFPALFAAGSKTPLACGLMMMEFFGIPVGLGALLSCFVATWASGMQGIYQK